jgi:hypothetical protein
MVGPLASRLALLGLALLAVVMAEPHLTVAMEREDDRNPQRLALTGEVLGRSLGVVISWSGGDNRQLLGYASTRPSASSMLRAPSTARAAAMPWPARNMLAKAFWRPAGSSDCSRANGPSRLRRA